MYNIPYSSDIIKAFTHTEDTFVFAHVLERPFAGRAREILSRPGTTTGFQSLKINAFITRSKTARKDMETLEKTREFSIRKIDNHVKKNVHCISVYLFFARRMSRYPLPSLLLW